MKKITTPFILISSLLVVSCSESATNQPQTPISRQNFYQTNTDSTTLTNPLTPQAYQAINQLKFNRPVIDTANVFTSQQKSQLEVKIRQIFAKNILQTGVVTVDTTYGTPIFDYTMAIANRWKLGTVKDNNGLLIVIAVNDRKIHILTGTGIEKRLTDSEVKQVLDNVITPNFPKANYYLGIDKGIDALIKQL